MLQSSLDHITPLSSFPPAPPSKLEGFMATYLLFLDIRGGREGGVLGQFGEGWAVFEFLDGGRPPNDPQIFTVPFFPCPL